MSEPRALVTGIAGQDGSYLAELLIDKGYEVVGIVRRDPASHFASLERLRDRIELRQGDLSDPRTIVDALSAVRPDEVYNLAANSFVPASWERPVEAARLETVAVPTMLEAMRAADHPMRLFHAASSEIFAGATRSPMNEDAPLRPRSPYGAAKAYSLMLVAAYRERYGLHASTGIMFNHESARRPERFVTRKVTRAAAEIKLGLRDQLALGDLDATRDWGYAGDFMRAAWLMLQRDSAGDYVLATGIGRTVRELVETAFSHAGLEPDAHVTVDESFVRPSESAPLIGDPAKAHRELGWEPTTTFEDMIAGMVDTDLRLLSRS